MIKLHTTQKAIKENYPQIIKLSYCSAQALLRFQQPFAYNSGVYGWNCDYYDINGICICIGYHPHGNIIPNYDIVTKYERKAEKTVNSILNYTLRVEVTNNYLKEFIREVLTNV